MCACPGRAVRIRSLGAGLLVVGALGIGCGDDDDGDAALTCVEIQPADCLLGFTPTWPEVYENVVRKSCGGAGTGASCHAADGKQGGLDLSTSAAALSALLGEDDGKPRVIPGDPACSSLIERIESDDPALRMPLGGAKLPESTRCAIQQWIAAGAQP